MPLDLAIRNLNEWQQWTPDSGQIRLVRLELEGHVEH